VEARQFLQRNVAVEILLAGEINHGHATPADLADDLVAADAACFGHACTLV
jgi:hypothetical protein